MGRMAYDTTCAYMPHGYGIQAVYSFLRSIGSSQVSVFSLVDQRQSLTECIIHHLSSGLLSTSVRYYFRCNSSLAKSQELTTQEIPTSSVCGREG